MLKRFFENVKKPKNSFAGRLMAKGMNRGHEKLAVWARSFLSVHPDDVVVDLGCGGGRNVQYFLTKADRVYGMDYSSTSVSVASKLNREAIEQGRCRIIEGEVSHLPFDADSVNIVTAFETVYFWTNLPQPFGEIYRILKSGGTFLICNEGSDPNQPSIKKWADMLQFTVYPGDELSHMLRQIGFCTEYHLDAKQHIVILARK